MDTLASVDFILKTHTYFAVACHFILCACFGSYFNLFAWRWPQIQERQWMAEVAEWFASKNWPAPTFPTPNPTILTLAHPSSFCPNCGSSIPMRYNIPVLGWLILRGRARCCGKPISLKYPLFEMLCGVLGAVAWLHYETMQATWIFLLFALPLCMASQTDFESMMLPDSITGFILFSGLGLAIFGQSNISAAQAFSGAFISFSSLALIRVAGTAVFKKEAMGHGDPKLFAAIGAWIGPFAIPEALLVASLAGLIFGLFSIWRQKSRTPSSPIPFGPFLALGAIGAYIYPWTGSF